MRLCRFLIECLVSILVSALFLATVTPLPKATAQIALIESSQPELIKRSTGERADLLAAAVRGSEQN